MGGPAASQLSLNGETQQFGLADLKHLEVYAGLPRNFHKQALEKTLDAFSGWKKVAKELDIPLRIQKHVLATLRMNWSTRAS